MASADDTAAPPFAYQVPVPEARPPIFDSGVFNPSYRATGVFPTNVANPETRFAAYLLTTALPSILWYVPVLGWLVALGIIICNLIMHRRGLDIGAVVVDVRVIRNNGDVAGFYHMTVRAMVSILSAIPFFAGYWTAFFDPNHQTWHDKIMGTYVVDDSDELESRPGTSSSTAVAWFWVVLLSPVALIVLAVIVAAMALSV
ncbi:MAG: RDD family protein [Dehalococcoidia bacterium]